MVRNQGPVFNKKPSLHYHVMKVKEWYLHGKDLYGYTDECFKKELVQKACRHLGFYETHDIVSLAMQLEEDIAIIHKGVLSAVCFCFPSSWIPSEKLGKSLTEIHSHVADGEMLTKMSDKLSETISDPNQGSFCRNVWTITTSAELSNHPAKKRDIKIRTLEQLYVRVETQITEPLGDGETSLFFVKVDVEPLINVWPQYKKLIVDSINSMSNNVLEYKNLRDIKLFLNETIAKENISDIIKS